MLVVGHHGRGKTAFLKSNIARQRDFANLAATLRAEAAELWRRRGFYRLLDRMLFRAAGPPERYKVLERFYRLDPALIARFYAGRSTMLDRMKVLSGKPPVPASKAAAGLRQRAK